MSAELVSVSGVLHINRKRFLFLETTHLKLRGVVSLLAVTLGMVLCDLVQRFLIGPLVWLIPSSRKRVLGAWMQAMAWLTSRPMVFLGGASIAPPPQVPFESGVLIIMNHQSLLDIPMVCTSVRGGYPLIVTRKRYRRWIPLISHMIRLYQYPVVDPTANRRDALGMTDNLSEVARTAEVPVAIFPEGTRTKDGNIGRFKKAGLRRILQARAWKVYVLVGDGFWKYAKFKNFLSGINEMNGEVAFVSELEWNDPTVDPDPFIGEVRKQMVAGLAQMRGESIA